MKDYVLKNDGTSSSLDKDGIVWAFDLGKGSVGEAVRQGTNFLHKASLLIAVEFKKVKTGKGNLAGFVLETLFNAACPHGEQWHGLRYLTLS